MANPEQAWNRIKELDTDGRDHDINVLATFCVELDGQVIKPLITRVAQLEHEVILLKSRLAACEA